jgi:hypothetical protein
MLRTPSLVVVGITTVLYAACSSQTAPTSPSFTGTARGDAVSADTGVRATVGPMGGTSSAHNACHPDVTAPTISNVSATPNTLWSPNHKWNNVTVGYSATDLCSPPLPVCALTVTSNEPTNGLGDGNTAIDWEVLGTHSVRLRAERSGTGRGRVYTITINCTDAAGNAATARTAVTVAHDQRKG